MRGFLLRGGLSSCPLSLLRESFCLKSRLPCFESLARVIRTTLFLLVIAHLPFGCSIVLNQWNLAWTDVSTGTALDAVKQSMFRQLFVIFSARIPIQLLW